MKDQDDKTQKYLTDLHEMKKHKLLTPPPMKSFKTEDNKNFSPVKNSVKTILYPMKKGQPSSRKIIPSQEIREINFNENVGSMDEIFGNKEIEFTDIKFEMEKEEKILKKNLKKSLNKLEKKKSVKKKPTKNKKIKAIINTPLYNNSNLKNSKSQLKKDKSKSKSKIRKKKSQAKNLKKLNYINSNNFDEDQNETKKTDNSNENSSLIDFQDISKSNGKKSFWDKLDMPRKKIVSIKKAGLICNTCINNINIYKNKELKKSSGGIL